MLDAKDPEALSFGRRKLDESVFGAPKGRSVRAIPVCFNVVLPWILFMLVFSIMSFKIHHSAPAIAWALALSALFVPLTSAFLGYRAKRSQLDPLWYAFAAFSCLLAVVCGIGFGHLNFVHNTDPFYKISTLNMYPNVNVARSKGGQFTDAGRIYFTKGTGIDMTRAMGFRSSELYCVAPIVIGNGKLESYDFWAVGKNCCSGVSSDFRCGDYNIPAARAGLRQLNDDERAYYRLAVQQAEAAYGIKVTHPLFFEWIQDPFGKIEDSQATGLQNWLIGIFAYFAFSVVAVFGTVMLAATGSIGGF